MQELLGRIAALDPSASLGLRVIACFDELVVGNVNLHGLLATAAALAGCPAGVRRGDAVTRVSVLGEALSGDAPGEVHALEVDAGTGGVATRVWLERHGPELANDAIIVERLALAVGIRYSGGSGGATRDVARLLDRDADLDRRREAAARLHLSPTASYRALATPLFADWSSHPSWPADVTATAIGTIHAVIAPGDLNVSAAPSTPCGLGVATTIDGLADSFRTALIALQLCERPTTTVVDAAEYGGLVHLLAESPSDARNPDADSLESLMTHAWARPTIAALLDASSVRQAARALDIHHSTMQTRLENVSAGLGFDPLDGMGRARLGVAFLTWRMRHSRALELPPQR
ncbi:MULTISPECIES: helix-turn-helix domain-containing protein [unclassified Gordonia (in: high G+C Gram-positive bacteria)]|uniref:helix-turn-helix domain-containing protein n=1 Tax=Gordonia sp. VNQ95 TaxID=3156619 RepID=UPI0032B42395